jgi:hypothetical protein
MGAKTFYGKQSHPLLWADSWVAREKITVSGKNIYLTAKTGRAMVEVVSRRPLTAEARVRSRGQSM